MEKYRLNPPLEVPPKDTRRFSVQLKNVYVVAIVSLVPLALTSFIWLEVVHGVASRAIDGSGHYAIAQIYSQSIFPDTFGWTDAYFGGMSFPNFYPPLFFWIVSLIHHSHLFSFATSFKLVVALPLVLMPATFWAIAYTHAGKDNLVALSTAIASAVLYSTGEVFQPNTGLDMSSTLLDGFYTQPLGFLLLLLWILVYLLREQTPWQFGLCSILLALTVLANFFNAITAMLFIASVVLSDIVSWFRSKDRSQKQALRKATFVHLLSPFIALSLTGFWVVPMLSTYQYLVTRPVVRPLGQLITTPLWCWYLLAAFGIGIWRRNSVGRIGPYLVGCLVLLCGLIFAGTLAPSWFPLQVFRFFATVNFLFCLPVGFSIAYVAKLYLLKRKAWASASVAQSNENQTSNVRRLVAISVVAIVGLSLLAVVMSTKKLTEATAFYTAETYERIRGLLEFARAHNDGRYLVEVLPSKAKTGLVRSDSLALNAYLGAQGNETISIVYREASPNSNFFNAELNAFSAYQENFGISSALIDDLDFIHQPLSQHLTRLQFIGVRYLVIATPSMKERLAQDAGIAERYEIGDWTVFAVRQPAAPQIRALQYRPALVLSDFTLKLRRQNQLDFIRLAEEQFSDAWFDVLLTRSAEIKLDRLTNLEDFGALIIDKYEYQDQDRAFNLIKDFAQAHSVVLLSSSDPLFSRIKSSLANFPHAYLIDRPVESPGQWIDDLEPSHHYKSSAIQELWHSIKLVLNKEKIAVPRTTLVTSTDQTVVRLRPNTAGYDSKLPVLISQTYHPKWIRNDGAPVYAITPFFTLTFVNEQTELVFERSRYDRAGMWCSILTLIAILGLAVSGYWRDKRPFRRNSKSRNTSGQLLVRSP